MRVLLGPYNTAGGASRLSKALRDAGIDAESAAVDRSRARPLYWPPDRLLPPRWEGRAWDRHLATFTHFLLWSGLSLKGHNRWFDQDSFPKAAVVATGSELRLPLVHKQLEPYSPFGDDALSQKLIVYSARFHQRFVRNPLPLFVLNAGMIDYRPSTWLPIIADPVSAPPPLIRKRPVVLYAPTNGLLKGAQYVDALEPDGYDFHRPDGLISPAEMEQAIADCDILIGGLCLGDFGHTETQGLAAGKLVVANLSPRVVGHMPEGPPFVHATPDTLASVLADVVANRDKYRPLAAQGVEWWDKYASGPFSVQQLGGFLT